MTTPDLWSTEQVAEHLGIKPQSVRAAMSRYGIRARTGWPREQIEKLQRPGKGRRREL